MTTISLFVQDPGGEHKEIDLDNIWIHSDVTGEDSMHALLVHEIALWAIENGNTFDQITGLTVDDDAGQELEIHSNGHGWIREVVQLYMWLNCDKHYCPDEAILARVDDIGWKWFDFDSDLQSAEDEYHTEFSGDYEEFAIEYMENCGESIDSHLESYFDFADYGEALVDDFDRCSWGHKEYLFSQ